MSEYTHKTLRELASRPPGDLGAGVLLMQMRATLLACADTWEADIEGYEELVSYLEGGPNEEARMVTEMRERLDAAERRAEVLERRLYELEASERWAEEAETWWPKPWPREFDGPVIVFAPSANPHRPFMSVAWWDGESLTCIPSVWVDAVTHIRPMPRGPAPDDWAALDAQPEEPR